MRLSFEYIVTSINLQENTGGGTTTQGSRRRVVVRSKIASRTERKDRESYEAVGRRKVESRSGCLEVVCPGVGGIVVKVILEWRF